MGQCTGSIEAVFKAKARARLHLREWASLTDIPPHSLRQIQHSSWSLLCRHTQKRVGRSASNLLVSSLSLCVPDLGRDLSVHGIGRPYCESKHDAMNDQLEIHRENIRRVTAAEVSP